MLLPLQIPKDYNDVVDVEERWDSSNPDRIVDLSIHWGELSAEHVFNWQRDFNGYCLDVDHVSSVFLKDLVAASLDLELKKQVDEKYKLLDGYKKGGISFFKLAVCRRSNLQDEQYGRGVTQVFHQGVWQARTSQNP